MAKDPYTIETRSFRHQMIDLGAVLATVTLILAVAYWVFGS